MESDLEKSVLASLDGRDNKLLPYIPYLLQDMWELGSLPQDIIKLIKKHDLPLNRNSSVLDLGCGKGAVAINLAREFGCNVLGIDGVPDFIAEAQRYAEQHKVEAICTFKVGDIREDVRRLSGIDLAILGSIGPVFGDMEKTIKSVIPCLNDKGYLVIDEGYLTAQSTVQKEHCFKRPEILAQIQKCPVQIIDEYYIDESALGDMSDEMYEQIKQRVTELSEKFPQQKSLFTAYLKNQQEEFTILENDMQGVTWLLQYHK